MALPPTSHFASAWFNAMPSTFCSLHLLTSRGGELVLSFRGLNRSWVQELQRLYPEATVIITVGGSPCVDITGLNAHRRGLDGAQSSLLFEMVRVQKLLEKEWPPARHYALLENVASGAATEYTRIS